MTITEAMYCMQTYFSDDVECEKCPYYRSEKIVIDGVEFYKCKEQEAHELVYKEIRENNMRNNKKVINLGGSNNGKTEQLLHVNGGSERT